MTEQIITSTRNGFDIIKIYTPILQWEKNDLNSEISNWHYSNGANLWVLNVYKCIDKPYKSKLTRVKLKIMHQESSNISGFCK